MIKEVIHETVCILNLRNPGCASHTASQVELVNTAEPRQPHALLDLSPSAPNSPGPPSGAPSTSIPISSLQSLWAPRFSHLLACHDSPTSQALPARTPLARRPARSRRSVNTVPARAAPGGGSQAPAPPHSAAAAAHPPPQGRPGSSGPESWT